MHRAGELTAVRVPTPAEEAVRDLVRARVDVVDDRKRMQQRLSAVLMRHGRVWRGGSTWTAAHRQPIKDRMDITGARWSLAGAETILTPRTLVSNSDLDAYWRYHLHQEHHRVHRAQYHHSYVLAA